MCHVINWNINSAWQFQVHDNYISCMPLENNFLYIFVSFPKKSYIKFLLICGWQSHFIDLALVNATSLTKNPSRFQRLDSWRVWKSQWKFFHQKQRWLYSILTRTILHQAGGSNFRIEANLFLKNCKIVQN